MLPRIGPMAHGQGREHSDAFRKVKNAIRQRDSTWSAGSEWYWPHSPRGWGREFGRKCDYAGPRELGEMTDTGHSYWTEVAATLPSTFLLFGYALLFALVEIEIEGKNGWAMNLPTWFRRRPWYARVYAFLLSGKPLTGYHAVMFFIPFLSFHIGLAFGQPWSWQLEARMVATYLVWNMTWDVLWFLWNPAYGWARFRKGEIWWHSGVWVGRLPIDYVHALWLSFLVAALPWLISRSGSDLKRHASYVGTMILLTALANVLAPLYRRWYEFMRRPGTDERPVLGGGAGPTNAGGSSEP